jgi:Flp pilus assembly protein TadG
VITSRRDSGQIGVLVVALAAVCLAVVQGMVRFGDALVDSARAQSVADAVALAVAAGRSDVIDRVIDGGDVSIVSIDDDQDVTVRVSVNGRVAIARAATTP